MAFKNIHRNRHMVHSHSLHTCTQTEYTHKNTTHLYKGAKWHSGFEPHQIPRLFLRARNYPHCLVLVDSRNRFQQDFTIKLK